MNRTLPGLFLLSGLIFAGSATALDATDKRYIDRLAKGGPDTLREVAESLYQSGSTNTEVLDVAAEVLLQRYQRASLDRGSADAMAWLCRALGGSGNNRYKAAVEEVAHKAENRRLRGHCGDASKALPKDATNSYVAGTVNLQNLRDGQPVAASDARAQKRKSSPTKSARSAQKAGAPAATVDFSLIREGMSAQEVTDILGQPTATTRHMTGKQFVPFNFGARDLQRMIYLYKGVGRIELSLKSAYQGVYRVIAITPDSAESGYP